MSILSTNQRLISIGESYSAGNGIDITDQIISVTGDATPYSAGDNIDIQDHIISGKDWSQDITDASANAYNETTAWVQENYANSADMTYISGVVDNKLDTTAWSTVSGNLATEDYVIMADNINYNQMSAFVINQHYASESNLNSAFDYLNTNKLDNSAFNLPNSAKWDESTNVVETNSAAWFDNVGDAEVNNFVYTNSATINDVDTSYIQNSGTFLTAHQVIPSAKWEDASDVVQSNSAQWSENTGDEEVNNAVYNNSAKWNDITVYQTNSASYLTAHQDLSNYATTGDLNTASGILSGAIDYLSGNAGKTYTGISPIVVNNDTNEISADSQDITFGEGLDFTNGVLTVTGAGTTYSGDVQEALDEVYANSGVWLTAHQVIPSAKWEEASTAYEQNSATYLTAHQDISNKLDTTAFSTVSGTFLTAHQPISANEWNSVYETVETNSGSWAGGGTSLTGDAQGAVDEVYSNSANWNSNYSTVSTNSASWGGTPLPMSAGEGIDIQIENDTLVISATGGAGNPEVESYVQTNSASIDDAVSTYETNSASYLTAHQSISADEWNSVYDTVEANSGSWTGGSSPTYDYTEDGLISAIDTSGLFAQGLLSGSHIGRNIVWDGGMGISNASQMWLNPDESHFAITSGIYGPLQYATGAAITYGSSGMDAAQYFGGYLKGNEWFVSNATAGQALRGETHNSRGVHISGATTAGNSFDLSVNAVSGKNDTSNGYNWKLERGGVSGKSVSGEWYYGPAEDAALRTVSALEYNAVDEISGIAGSAIAQYGAEKQWLQHDDTIVHVANSAQYAFGVNVSALQRLMGIDETVLWSGTRTSAVTLSEPASSFSTIRITKSMGGDITVPSDRYYIGFCDNISNDSVCYWCVGRFVLNGANLSVNKSKTMNIGAWTSTSTTITSVTNNWDYGTNIITKVIGIGRKA